MDTMPLLRMHQFTSRRGTPMKLAATFTYAAVAASLTCLAPSARADIVKWTYDWSHSPNTVWAHKSHADGIHLTSPGLKNAAGSSHIIATYFTTFTDDPDKPAH